MLTFPSMEVTRTISCRYVKFALGKCSLLPGPERPLIDRTNLECFKRVKSYKKLNYFVQHVQKKRIIREHPRLRCFIHIVYPS